MAGRFGTTHEAAEWLRRNENPSALGTNVLRTTENALRLVEDLYAAGAQRVHVTNINEHPGTLAREGGPYADTLLIRPPREDWRAFIFAMAALDADEVSLLKDKSGLFFRVWWD